MTVTYLLFLKIDHVSTKLPEYYIVSELILLIMQRLVNCQMTVSKSQCGTRADCCKKWQKSPNRETGLGTRGHLKVMNDTILVLNEHE